VAISGKTRKLLWGRSYNACAICKKSLTRDADSPHLRRNVLGEEAHIVAKRPDGPRGDGDRSDVGGVLGPDTPPRARQRANAKVIDVDHYATAGLIGPDWLWKIEPGEPLGDDGEAAYLVKVAAVVTRSRAARARMRSQHGTRRA